MATTGDGPAVGEESPSLPRPVVSSLRWWLLGVCIVVLLIAETWSAISTVQRTKQLNELLSSSFSIALRLERTIGYGGLIHNFKNYLLRPDQDQFYFDAMADAARASVLVEQLDGKLQQLGIDADLDRNADMIETYRFRLDQVRDLSTFALSAREIDQRVRFDDERVVAESERLIEELILTVRDKIAKLQRNAFVILSLIGSLMLGLLFVAWSLWNSRRYVHTISLRNTQLSLSNRKLSAANESLQRFAGITSHHLKTPLRHIGFHCEELLEEPADEHRITAHVVNVKECVADMDLITDSLLDYTQTSAQTVQVEPVELAALVGTVCTQFRQEILARGARVEVHGMPTVYADRKLLGRVLASLISNSLKYASAEAAPRILIEQVSRPGFSVISITDNGIGVAARFAEDVFLPLHRLHGRNSAYQGVGIGLALVRSIVSAHGGRVWMDTGYKSGTRICFELPGAETMTREAA